MVVVQRKNESIKYNQFFLYQCGYSLSCVTGNIQMESAPIKTEFLNWWTSAFWQIEDGI